MGVSKYIHIHTHTHTHINTHKYTHKCTQYHGKTVLVGVDDLDIFKGIELKLEVGCGCVWVCMGVYGCMDDDMYDRCDT